MESVTRVQNLDWAVCISIYGNDLKKGMNPSVLPSHMRNLLGRHDSFSNICLTHLWDPKESMIPDKSEPGSKDN